MGSIVIPPRGGHPVSKRRAALDRIRQAKPPANQQSTADLRRAAQKSPRQDHGVPTDLHPGLDVRRDRVSYRHAVSHVPVEDAAREDLLGLRQVRPVVDERRLLRVFQHVGHGPAVTLTDRAASARHSRAKRVQSI